MEQPQDFSALTELLTNIVRQVFSSLLTDLQENPPLAASLFRPLLAEKLRRYNGIEEEFIEAMLCIFPQDDEYFHVTDVVSRLLERYITSTARTNGLASNDSYSFSRKEDDDQLDSGRYNPWPLDGVY
jgi:hypothetical protein